MYLIRHSLSVGEEIPEIPLRLKCIVSHICRCENSLKLVGFNFILFSSTIVSWLNS